MLDVSHSALLVLLIVDSLSINTIKRIKKYGKGYHYVIKIKIVSVLLDTPPFPIISPAIVPAREVVLPPASCNHQILAMGGKGAGHLSRA